MVVLFTTYYLNHHHKCCTKNTAQGGVSKDKYSTRQSQVLYLPWDMPSSALFFVHMSSSGAMSGVLYFELLLNCKMDSSNDALRKQSKLGISKP